MKLTEAQRQIVEMCGVSPELVAARMAAEDQDSSDGEGDEIDAALNHLGAECVSGSAEHLGHVEAARDCLSQYLARKKGGAEHSSMHMHVKF